MRHRRRWLLPLSVLSLLVVAWLSGVVSAFEVITDVQPLPWEPDAPPTGGNISTCYWNRWSDTLHMVGHSTTAHTDRWGHGRADLVWYNYPSDHTKTQRTIDEYVQHFTLAQVMADHNILTWTKTGLSGQSLETCNRYNVTRLRSTTCTSGKCFALSNTARCFQTDPVDARTVANAQRQECASQHVNDPPTLSYPTDSARNTAWSTLREGLQTESENWGSGFEIPMTDGEYGTDSATTNKVWRTFRSGGEHWLQFSLHNPGETDRRTTHVLKRRQKGCRFESCFFFAGGGGCSDLGPCVPAWEEDQEDRHCTCEAQVPHKTVTMTRDNWQYRWLVKCSNQNPPDEHCQRVFLNGTFVYDETYALFGYTEQSTLPATDTMLYYLPHSVRFNPSEKVVTHALSAGQMPTCVRYLRGGVQPLDYFSTVIPNLAGDSVSDVTFATYIKQGVEYVRPQVDSIGGYSVLSPDDPPSPTTVKAWCGAADVSPSPSLYGGSLDCQNGGVLRGINQCFCASGWTGTICDVAIPGGDTSGEATATECPDFDICSGRGTCNGNRTGLGLVCECRDGWFGNALFANVYASQIVWHGSAFTEWTNSFLVYGDRPSFRLSHYAQLHQCLFWGGAARPSNWFSSLAIDPTNPTSSVSMLVPTTDGGRDYRCADGYGGFDCGACPACDAEGTDECTDNVDRSARICVCKNGWGGTLCSVRLFATDTPCNGQGTLYGTLASPLPTFNQDNEFDVDIHSLNTTTSGDPLIAYTTGTTISTIESMCVCNDGFGGSSGTCNRQLCPVTDDGVCGGASRGTCVRSSCANVTYKVNVGQTTPYSTAVDACALQHFGLTGCELPDYCSAFPTFQTDPVTIKDCYRGATCPHVYCLRITAFDIYGLTNPAALRAAECDPREATQFALYDQCLLDNAVNYVQTTHTWSTACDVGVCECEEGWALSADGSCSRRLCPFYNGQECNGLVTATGASVCNNTDVDNPKCECWRAAGRGTPAAKVTGAYFNGPAAACERPYEDTCDPYQSGTYCSGFGKDRFCVPGGSCADTPGGGCMPPSCENGLQWGTCSGRDTEYPSCRCETSTFGEICQYSYCGGASATACNRHLDSGNQCILDLGTNTYSCRCAVDYEGTVCERYVGDCVGGSADTSRVCSGRGTCTLVNSTGSVMPTPAPSPLTVCSGNGVWDTVLGGCLCDVGWEGDYCDSLVACENGGIVIVSAAGELCFCPPQWTGRWCTILSNGTATPAPTPAPTPVPTPSPARECVCESGFNGTYCENELPCGGSSCNLHGVCVANVCQCDSTWSGTYCATDLCTASGGTRINNITCQCSATGVYWPNADASKNPPVSPDDPSFTEGCRRLCPTSPSLVDPENGEALECGGIWTNADGSNPRSRCESIVNDATAGATPLTCDCNSVGVNEYTNTTMNFPDGSGGLCEPFCKYCEFVTGVGCDTSATSQFGGSRCDTERCPADGATWNGFACECSVPWAQPNASNCSQLTTICDETAYGSLPGVDVTLLGESDTCNCTYPYQADTNPLSSTFRKCISACGLDNEPDDTLGTCVCALPYTGATCQETLCAHLSTPAATVVNGSYCECLPQWTGPFCNISACTGGVPREGLDTNTSAPRRNCECYPMWTGSFCNVSLCAQGNTSASVNASSCDCEPGWSGAYCDVNGCEYEGIFPVPVAEGNLTEGQVNYTCNCGEISTFDNTTGRCTPPLCLSGVVLVNETAGSLYCECEENWYGVSCDNFTCSDPRQTAINNTLCECLDPYRFSGGVCGVPTTCDEYQVLFPIPAAGYYTDMVTGKNVSWTPSNVTVTRHNSDNDGTVDESMCRCANASYVALKQNNYFLGCVLQSSTPSEEGAEEAGVSTWRADSATAGQTNYPTPAPVVQFTDAPTAAPTTSPTLGPTPAPSPGPTVLEEVESTAGTDITLISVLASLGAVFVTLLGVGIAALVKYTNKHNGRYKHKHRHKHKRKHDSDGL